ncbi:MAG: hypothetical protein MSS13_04655 [Sutterella parvirubra]|uniref:Intracellular septation protein A n=1 Tax=Sutterella parvirubra YIT 11816 TaxID=762967 RepID=H3KE96_9BURK|nr:hypothetical protein [Sutterella parvirubra]EHY31561.1 hypothetical protein HMPREF9440_01060 [Sutterella parvirubra YIT 11816]MCI7708998.1 hypothetical protein [Sutterella parvirubra]MDR3770629.1 hypothetical protein [Sutterella sp.]MDY5202307.1 hypothetical protein [Sutterella parvirubra]
MLRRLIAVLLTLAYPFAVLWGLRAWGVVFLSAAVLLFGAANWLLTRTKTSAAVFGVSAALSGAALLLEDGAVLKLYPVFVNLLMLSIFGASLTQPESFIERLARLKTPDLPPEAVRYTRRLTMVWCAFFVANGGAALWTVWSGDDVLWALYNGFVSYLLIGALMGGEWLYRRFVLKV